jgi:hypothetical protein
MTLSAAEDHTMGLFNWLLDHGDDEQESAEDKVLVPPQRARVEEAEVVIIPFGVLHPNELGDEDSAH